MVNYQALQITLSVIALCALVVPIIVQFSNAHRFPFLCLFFWLGLQTLQNVINGSIWGGSNFFEVWNGKVYCDILVYLNDATMTGLICSVAGICFFLYNTISTTNFICYSPLKRNLIYAAICLISPTIILSLSYLLLVQRFAVVRFDGCTPVHGLSYMNLIILCLLPFLWSVVVIGLASLTILAFFRKRSDVKDILHCTNSGLTLAKFAKTLAFCIITICIEVPVLVIYSIFNFKGNQQHYSFSETHNPVTWNQILIVPHDKPFYGRWIYVSVCYLSFIIFGLGENTIPIYKKILRLCGLGYFVKKYDQYRQDKKDKKYEAEDKELPLNQVFKSNSKQNELFYTKSNIFDDFSDYDEEESISSTKHKHGKHKEKIRAIELSSLSDHTCTLQKLNPNYNLSSYYSETSFSSKSYTQPACKESKIKEDSESVGESNSSIDSNQVTFRYEVKRNYKQQDCVNN